MTTSNNSPFPAYKKYDFDDTIFCSLLLTFWVILLPLGHIEQFNSSKIIKNYMPASFPCMAEDYTFVTVKSLGKVFSLSKGFSQIDISCCCLYSQINPCPFLGLQLPNKWLKKKKERENPGIYMLISSQALKLRSLETTTHWPNDWPVLSVELLA